MYRIVSLLSSKSLFSTEAAMNSFWIGILVLQIILVVGCFVVARIFKFLAKRVQRVSSTPTPVCDFGDNLTRPL